MSSSRLFFHHGQTNKSKEVTEGNKNQVKQTVQMALTMRGGGEGKGRREGKVMGVIQESEGKGREWKEESDGSGGLRK